VIVNDAGSRGKLREKGIRRKGREGNRNNKGNSDFQSVEETSIPFPKII
jgi:hypothetical protein